MHVSVMHIYPWCMYPYASKVLNILGTQPLQICNFQTSWATFTVCLFGFYNETYDCPTFESRLVSRLAQSQIRVAITCNIWLSHFVCLLEYIFCSIYLLEYITLWQCHSCSYLYTITDQTGNHMQDLTESQRLLLRYVCTLRFHLLMNMIMFINWSHKRVYA